jgi:hypothetical protein
MPLSTLSNNKRILQENVEYRLDPFSAIRHINETEEIDGDAYGALSNMNNGPEVEMNPKKIPSEDFNAEFHYEAQLIRHGKKSYLLNQDELILKEIDLNHSFLINNNNEVERKIAAEDFKISNAYLRLDNKLEINYALIVYRYKIENN